MADALVADLFPVVGPGAVGPGVVGQRIGDRFVVLVAEPAVDLAIGDAVGIVPVLAQGVGGVERVIGIDQHRRQGGVPVVRAEGREVGGLTRRAAAEACGRVIAEAALDVRRRQQEVLVAEVGLQAVGGDEVLELCLDLGVGEACGHRRGRRALVRRVRIGVEQRTAEGRLVPRERAGQVVVLGRHRVDVLMAAAVVGQVLEVALQT